MKGDCEERRSIVRGWWVALVLLMLGPAAAWPAQYFVAVGGSDSAAGTIGSPYRTIPKAVSVAVAGDTIYVRGGTYTLTTTISISKSGNSSNRLHLYAYPGERPLLDYSSMAIGSSNRGFNFSGSWWHVYGLDIKGAGDNGMFMSGSNNIVEFCSFSENHDTGLQIGGGASNNRIVNCDSYYNADPSQGNADGFAAKLDVGTGNYFYGCRSWQNSDDGWDGYLRPSDSVFTTYENCWCFKNGYLKDGTASAGNGNGFKTGGSDLKNLRHNCLYIRCVSFDNRVKGFDQNNNIGSITLLNCTAYNNGTNYKIDAPLAAGETLTVKNCDVLGPYGSLGSFAVQQTNSWLPGFSVTAGDFMSTNSAEAYAPRKPDGTLPDVAFMHLAAGSDLIDAGTDIGLPWHGAGPDLGAFESPVRYTITASAGAGGSLLPSGAVAVDSTADTTFSVVPDAGRHCDTLLVDGSPVAPAPSWTFHNVVAPHTIAASFAVNIYTLTASVAGSGGTISPVGSTQEPYGDTLRYLITPALHHHLDSLVVDGVRVDSVAGYTFAAIAADHAVTAYFGLNIFTLAAGFTGAGHLVIAPDSAAYPESTLVRITAVPDSSSRFTGWSGDVADTVNPLTLTMDRNFSVTASFVLKEYAFALAVGSGWNMVSLPAQVPDARKTTLFPSASSRAFAYEGSYIARDTLVHGRGYWVKFAAPDTAAFGGPLRLNDTIAVAAGWNIIGSVSANVPVGAVTSIPPGIATSQLYFYNGSSYSIADTIRPGRAYWIKPSQGGSLILAAPGSGAAPGAAIRITARAGLPPSPPQGDAAAREIPRAFALSENFPNPFNPSTTLIAALPEARYVEAAVYNLLGERVALLAAGSYPAGYLTLRWDGSAVSGAAAPSGVYLVRIAAGDFSAVRKILLMK